MWEDAQKESRRRPRAPSRLAHHLRALISPGGHELLTAYPNNKKRGVARSADDERFPICSAVRSPSLEMSIFRAGHGLTLDCDLSLALQIRDEIMSRVESAAHGLVTVAVLIPDVCEIEGNDIAAKRLVAFTPAVSAPTSPLAQGLTSWPLDLTAHVRSQHSRRREWYGPLQ